MKLVINKDRTVYSAGTWGTKNENDYEILEFDFPEELDEYNKRIVYYLDEERVWDAIVDNKAYITNAITKYEKVKAYVWLTKENTEREADTDFRTKLFEMKFYENENADGIVPTEEQVDGFNTMLTAMNRKIDEVNALEQTILQAETERQVNENARISNESTRQSNESTRATNEQTRQSQEAERERRTNEAIADIQDKTAEYNANAEAKTNEFNQNATQKTNEFNSNYTQKVNDFNSNATTQTSEFNSNASSKTSAFSSNAETKTNAFNTNATNKTNDFNSNATEKTTTFDNNASTKTTEFNTNAESKTSEFNTNATNKTNDFNTNADEKTDEFNTNAQNKIDEYDEHIVDYQAQIDELQEEVEELSENMPWNTTEQATEITVDDAAKYSKNKLELFGNTEQTQYTGVQLLDMSDTVNGYFVRDDGYYNTNTDGFRTEQYIDVSNNSKIYFRFEALDNIKIGRFYVQEYDENKNSLKRTTVGIYDSTFTAGQVRKYNKDLQAETKYIRLSAYRILVLENGEYIEKKPTKDYWNDLVKATISFSDVDIYEPYTNGPSPNPDYPQDIHIVTGNNTIGVQGENLIFNNLTNQTINGVTFVVNPDKSITINGTASATIAINILTNTIGEADEITLPAGTYTLQGCPTGGSSSGYKFDITNNGSAVITDYGNNVYSRTFTDSWVFDRVRIVVQNGTTVSNLTFKPMLVKGNTNVPYEPYVEPQNYPVNLGSLELCKIGNYQDYLYKENGNWYKSGAIKKLVSDDYINMSWSKSATSDEYSYFFSYSIDSTIMSSKYDGYCNLLNVRKVSLVKDTVVLVDTISFGDTRDAKVRLKIKTSRLESNDQAGLKAWFGDVNLISYIILATPVITQITDETLIAQLDAIYEHLQLEKGTNHITVTASDLKPYMKLTYMQDLKSKLDNLDSRLALLE